MTQSELLVVLKELIVETAVKANPAQGADLPALRKRVEDEIKPESPLTSLGWDSLQFTWLLVAVEERLDIDTSTLSLFDLFSVSDLLNELHQITQRKAS